MEDLSGKLNELLGNPAAMAQLQSLAASLGLGGNGSGEHGGGHSSGGFSGGSSGGNGGGSAPSSSGDSGLLAALSGLLGQAKEEARPAAPEGGDLTQAILRMAPLLGSLREETDSTRLLHALRPLLSPSRRQRLDQAVRLMQLMRVLPLLKGSGLF